MYTSRHLHCLSEGPACSRGVGEERAWLTSAGHCQVHGIASRRKGADTNDTATSRVYLDLLDFAAGFLGCSVERRLPLTSQVQVVFQACGLCLLRLQRGLHTAQALSGCVCSWWSRSNSGFRETRACPIRIPEVTEPDSLTGYFFESLKGKYGTWYGPALSGHRSPASAAMIRDRL